MFNLEGKCALVTGATGGIGAAIAKALHGAGATVGLSGTRENVLAERAAELGDRVHVLPCNLADAEAVAALIPAADETMGQVDILVNNAGITRDNLAMRMKDEEWDDVLAVNLSSSFRLARACLRGMMKRRHGRIISITSVVGTMGNPGQANYAASKAGTVGMSKALAQEVASRGITVNCIAPGFANGGKANGVQLLSAAGCERILEEQTNGPDLVLIVPLRFGMGFGLKSELMPIGPNQRVCFWGGWGGSIAWIDMDARMTVSYVMNKMEANLLGDQRGMGLVMAAYAALGA